MEHAYLGLLREIVEKGVHKDDRTGVGTRSLFGRQIRCGLGTGFPLLTTKKLHWKSIVHELLWMLSGSTNVRDLQKHGVTIWDEWAKPDGSLGPVYGKQWRDWKSHAWQDVGDSNAPEYAIDSIDQIKSVIDSIRKDPFSRRHVVSAWNVADVPHMALAPCHCLFQFNVRPMTHEQRTAHCRDQYVRQLGLEDLSTTDMDHVGVSKFYLDCQLYQRSADVFLGVPFNIASYALLTHMVAHVTNCVPGDFIHTFGDVHLYTNHVEQAREQLSRTPRKPPLLRLNKGVLNTDKMGDIFKITYDDIWLFYYDPHPAIKADVAV